jgi:hypothetical protein
MTRIIGRLDGISGALNGRLFVRASQPFIGAPSGKYLFA